MVLLFGAILSGKEVSTCHATVFVGESSASTGPDTPLALLDCRINGPERRPGGWGKCHSIPYLLQRHF